MSLRRHTEVASAAADVTLLKRNETLYECSLAFEWAPKSRILLPCPDAVCSSKQNRLIGYASIIAILTLQWRLTKDKRRSKSGDSKVSIFAQYLEYSNQFN